MNNLISIIIPAYNVEKFIQETLESIQKQDYSNWEAIVVDDGSTDHTVELIEAFIRHDSRFRLIRQLNGGVSKARNTGILAASGMYLAFLDGDDMWKSTFLSEMLNPILTNNISMTYCGYTHLYTNGLKRKFSYSYTSGNILAAVVQGDTQLHIGAILVKKEVVDKFGLLFTNGCLVGQDQEFLWKLASVVTVQAVPKELMIYRIRTGSAITAKWNWQKHIHAIYGFKRAAEYILQRSGTTYDAENLQQVLYQRVAYKLYKFLWRMIKNGYLSEAREVITNDNYNIYFSYLQADDLKLIDKLKYRIVFSQNEAWWKLAKIF